MIKYGVHKKSKTLFLHLQFLHFVKADILNWLRSSIYSVYSRLFSESTCLRSYHMSAEAVQNVIGAWKREVCLHC